MVKGIRRSRVLYGLTKGSLLAEASFPWYSESGTEYQRPAGYQGIEAFASRETKAGVCELSYEVEKIHAASILKSVSL